MEKEPKLKILHVLSQRPDSTGSGIYLQSIMREAAARGHDNFMIAGIQSDREAELHGIGGDQCRFIRFGGGDLAYPIPGMTDIMPYPSTRFMDLTAQEVKSYKAVFSKVLTDTAAAFRPDIIHTHHLWLVSSLVRRLFTDIPVVTTCHGTDLRQFHNCQHLRAEVLKGIRHLDAAMALSAVQKKEIEETYGLPPERVRITWAGYNDQVFTRSSKPEPAPVQLVYAGKLINAKGLPWLLKALHTIATPHWQLHLVGGGSGPEKDACLRLAEDLGERVVVHGQVPQVRLAEIFRQAHIFVLPSFFEGLPLVVLEALASGCRVVATDLPGVKEVLGDVEAEYIGLVPTPRLRNMDQPYPEDLDGYVHNMARALEIQMTRATAHPQIDLDRVADKLAAFRWQGVFGKVEQIYYEALSKREKEQGQQ